MKILAITQARVGSSRFPEKILKEVHGETLLEIHIKRILRSKNITQLKIATTNEPDAFKIVNLAKKLGIESYKGSLNNVLERFYFCAKSENPDYVVRLTSDCPLIDACVIDLVIDIILSDNTLDYISNTLNPTYPDGMDVEVFKFSALEKAYNEASDNLDKEHVTPYIWRNSSMKGGSLFHSFSYENDQDYSKMRMTVDEPEDYIVIESLINSLGLDKSWQEYTNFLITNNEIQQLNQRFKRNEGYYKNQKKT